MKSGRKNYFKKFENWKKKLERKIKLFFITLILFYIFITILMIKLGKGILFKNSK